MPRTRAIRLVQPEVTREVCLVWVEGDPMLPMAKALLGTLKELVESGSLFRRLGGATKAVAAR